jgi:hypothetical protein
VTATARAPSTRCCAIAAGTLAELWRALRTLKALQAEAASRPHEMRDVAPALLPEPQTHASVGREKPIEPKERGNPGVSEPAPAASEPAQRPSEPVLAAAGEPDPAAVPALARRSQSNEPADREAVVGWGAGRTVPGAIAPPRERLNPAALPAQPSRSTP